MKSPHHHTAIPIMIVEDSLPDYESILRAFKKLGINNPVYHCEDGDEAMDFLYNKNKYSSPENAPRPGLILLDLNLPGTDGRDVLKQIKSDEKLKAIPVIILTTSNSDKDIRECYQNGANSYMTKPVDWDKFFKGIGNFKTYWLETAALPDPGL